MTDQKISPENEVVSESHKRRVFWGLLIGTILLLVLFFVVPNFVDTPLRISEETTILTEPRTPDGKRIDYLAYLEDRFGPKNAAENGFREIATATGRVPMENIGQDYWDEMCRKLDIDSLTPPTMPFILGANRPLFEAAHRESGSKEPFEKSPGEIAALPPELRNSHYAWSHSYSSGDMIRQWLEKYMAEPWSNEDFPELGECVDTLSPFLDLLGQSVRKDVYYIPVARARSSSAYDILLPCAQSQRQFGRYLVIRANRSLHAGDLDAAWYDLLSALRLGRHLKNDIFIVTQSVGNAIEWMVFPVMQEMLSRDDVTPEQLWQWRDDLKELPQAMSLEDTLLCQHLSTLDYLSCLSSGEGSRKHFTERYLPKGTENTLGIDWMLCARLVNRYFEKFREINDKDLTPAEKAAEFDAWLTLFLGEPPDEYWILLSKGHRSRSLVGDLVPSLAFFYTILPTGKVKTQLLIFACELEIEKRQNGRYPTTLDFLNDRYTPEQLADPFGKGVFVYKPNESGDGYLLYSVGQNGVDDGGKHDMQSSVYVAPSGPLQDDITIEMRYEAGEKE